MVLSWERLVKEGETKKKKKKAALWAVLRNPQGQKEIHGPKVRE